jgi:SSS family solute:Na+ symporter
VTQLIVIVFYLFLLIGLGLLSSQAFRGTAKDFFAASHSIGPVMLLMSVFGTTMTAFALVGSTGESYRAGIGVYGLLASWSGLVHAGVFFFIGIRLWAYGKRYGYLTQIQFLRDRYDSDLLGLLLFSVLVGLVIPYLLTGLLGAGSVGVSLTQGAFPEAFASTGGGIPPWLTGFVICGVVLMYVFFGGLRGAAWANTFQTVVFMLTGLIAFALISSKLGGFAAATQAVLEAHPEKLIRGDAMSPLQFFSYCLIPLSAGVFPHLFQHWLTARSAESFKLTVVVHPIFIVLVWTPCVLIGVWATSALMPDGSLVVPPGSPPNTELAIMVQRLTTPLLGGVLGAGIMAAIMSSLDSQFLALSSMFTNDIVMHYFGKERISDERQVWLGRAFVVAVVAVTYLASLFEPRSVFTLGVWCFSGFTALFPIVWAAVYWKRATAAGAIASIAVTAVVWLLLFRAGEYGANPSYLFAGMMPVATIFSASAVTLALVSLLTKAPSAARVAKFFPA